MQTQGRSIDQPWALGHNPVGVGMTFGRRRTRRADRKFSGNWDRFTRPLRYVDANARWGCITKLISRCCPQRGLRLQPRAEGALATDALGKIIPPFHGVLIGKLLGFFMRKYLKKLELE
jgi:hypothetical protein